MNQVKLFPVAKIEVLIADLGVRVAGQQKG
jgi:hypothetical protein